MKTILCLLATLTFVHAHGGRWSQGGGYPKQHSYGAGGGWNGKSYGAGLYGGGHKAAHTPPIVSHVSRNGDSTSFSIGQQGLVQPIAAAPKVSHANGGGLYGHSNGGGGLYGGSHGKSHYGESYGWGAAPESSFDYTVKHPSTYGSNYGWGSQSGLSANSYANDAVSGTSYQHVASGLPSQLYASPIAKSGWNGAGGSYKSKSAGWWAKRN